MATLKAVKKKLSSVCSIQKFSKAMKNISTMKYSRLNAAFAAYSRYSALLRGLYERNSQAYDRRLAPSDPSAPPCLVVIAASKGMCGAFNSSVLAFAEEELRRSPGGQKVVLCGAKAKSHFDAKGLPYEKVFILPDIPLYEDIKPLASYLKARLRDGGISSIRLATTKYRNIITQTPALEEFPRREEDGGDGPRRPEPLMVPDAESVVGGTADAVLGAFLYEAVLESALCVQASSLLAMRSAYDTSTEYRASLESEINKQRQGKITADVIETSAEFAGKGV